jgi:hypothetical protein
VLPSSYLLDVRIYAPRHVPRRAHCSGRAPFPVLVLILGLLPGATPIHTRYNTHQILPTAPPSLPQLTNFLDNLVPLLFLMLAGVGTIFGLFVWWWPKAPSNSIVVVQNTETHPQPKKCSPDCTYSSTISSPINRIF